MKAQGRSVAQFLAGFAPGDAISTEALNIQRVLRQEGHGSTIYSRPRHIHPHVRSLCGDVADFQPSHADLILYHFSTGSPITQRVLDFPGKKVMIYHNITPGDYFRPYDLKIAQELDEGRQELGSIADRFDVALADSEFNRRELQSLGYPRTGVLPILFDAAQFGPPPRRGRRRARREPGQTTLLFVGRLAPNKKAEDLLAVFAVYRKFMNPAARMLWVGSRSLHLYDLELQSLVAELGLENVQFLGHTSHSVLAECYEEADVFVSMSEHEGFCVPVLESFHYGKPVLAYAGGAVPETVGDAGIVFQEKDYLCFAEAIQTLADDADLRHELAARGKNRLASEYSFSRVSGLLKNYIEPLLG